MSYFLIHDSSFYFLNLYVKTLYLQNVAKNSGGYTDITLKSTPPDFLFTLLTNDILVDTLIV